MRQKSKTQEEVVSLTKSEFLHLQQQARAYQSLAAQVFALPLRDPVDEVVQDFRRTQKYTPEFIDDLDSGLRKFSYAKKHRNQASQKRS